MRTKREYEPLTAERQQLILGYLDRHGTPLNFLVICRRGLVEAALAAGMTYREIEAEGYYALVLAASSYDASRTEFDTHANNHVRWRLGEVITAGHAQCRGGFLNVFSLVIFNGEDGSEYEDCLCTYDEDLGDVEMARKDEAMARIILDRLSELPERERNVLDWKYGITQEAVTDVEVGRFLKVTKQTVRNIRLAALDNIRASL